MVSGLFTRDLKRLYVMLIDCFCVSMNEENGEGGDVVMIVGVSVISSFLAALHVSLNGLIVPGLGSFVSMRSKNVFCRFDVCS